MFNELERLETISEVEEQVIAVLDEVATAAEALAAAAATNDVNPGILPDTNLTVEELTLLRDSARVRTHKQDS